MKIAHVTSELCRASAGLGVAVASISAATQQVGREVRVFGLSSPGWHDGDKATWSGAQAEVFEKVHWSGSFGFAPEMLEALKNFGPDIVHLHGLWTFPSIAAYRCCKIVGCPLVVSAHGMLTPVALTYSRRRKQLARWLYQDRVLRSAALLHATSEDEATSYRALRLQNPVELIGLGMNVVPVPDTGRDSIIRRVLFLGRLHHKKGIDWLIEAWVRLESDFPDWMLSIAGPTEPRYADEIELLKQICVGKRVTFLGPLYGEDKNRYMAGSDLFVLPSRSENFGLTVAESLMMEVPVIATKGTPWSGLVANNAGWWIEPGAASLEATMREAMNLTLPKLRNKGQNGRRWIEQSFSSQAVGEVWQSVYERLALPK